MVKSLNTVTVENFQDYKNITQIIVKKAFYLMDDIANVTEHERNSTTEKIKRLLNQLKINPYFSQMSAEHMLIVILN